MTTEALPAPPAQPRSVAAGRGVSWWTEAWAMFMKNPGMWIVFALISLVIFIVLSVIPILGSIAASLLTPVFVAGWMLAARKADSGGTLEVGDLFAGFQDKLTPLLVLGALLLAASLVIFFAVGSLGFGAVMGLVVGGSQQSAGGMMAALGAGLGALLMGLVLGALMAMAFWFAPALVVFRNLAPVDAVKASFAANLKNLLAFLVYGVVYIVAAIVASIPFGLGWIVLVPLSLLTVYVSYKEVFGA
jgi:uncharacterized membrane protein